MVPFDDAILVGVVARTHGNRGEVIVNPETDFPEARFQAGARLMSRRPDGREETMEIATMRMHQGRPVILFKGIASMNDADLLAGRELRIAESSGDDALLGEGEYYHRDLIGCEVVTESGESIGTVSSGFGLATTSRRLWRGLELASLVNRAIRGPGGAAGPGHSQPVAAIWRATRAAASGVSGTSTKEGHAGTSRRVGSAMTGHGRDRRKKSRSSLRSLWLFWSLKTQHQEPRLPVSTPPLS